MLCVLKWHNTHLPSHHSLPDYILHRVAFYCLNGVVPGLQVLTFEGYGTKAHRRVPRHGGFNELIGQPLEDAKAKLSRARR